MDLKRFLRDVAHYIAWNQVPSTNEPVKFIPPDRLTKLLWAACDLDGTLAYSKWTPSNPTYELGEPVPGALEKCQELVDHGFKIIVYTARPWSDYQLVEAWLDHHNFPYRRIEMGKLLAAVYIDDRGRHSTDDSWLPLETNYNTPEES